MTWKFRSFYWRIGISLVLFVIVVLTAQSLMVSYMMSRGPLRGRSPSNLAAIVAADVSYTLTHGATTDLQAYLTGEYGDLQPIYVVLRDGHIPGNRLQPLAEDLRRPVEAMLTGSDAKRLGLEFPAGGRPVAIAPVSVGTDLRGIVVLPPEVPSSTRLIGPGVGRLLSLPGIALLVILTALAAALIFEPARRRLERLERATRAVGAGDLTARAPEGGNDEIAYVAAAFNKMAADLAAREEALRTSDRLRRQMLADVSHELRTPLTAMRGYLETLRMPEANLDTTTRERYLETVERETQRLDRIVRDLLDLASLENRLGEITPRPFDICRLFAHVIRRHEQRAHAVDVVVRAEVADGADQIVADPDRLEQVIDNLTANALRYTSAGGSVTLRAAAHGDAIVLSVLDSGAGIAPEHLPLVFERFYKVDEARATGGSGLGLSIVKAIVERHGGTIDVASRPGRTEFTIVLPQAAVHDAPTT